MASTKSEFNQKSDADFSITEVSQDQLIVEFQENSPRNPPNWPLVRLFTVYYCEKFQALTNSVGQKDLQCRCGAIGCFQ